MAWARFFFLLPWRKPFSANDGTKRRRSRSYRGRGESRQRNGRGRGEKESRRTGWKQWKRITSGSSCCISMNLKLFLGSTRETSRPPFSKSRKRAHAARNLFTKWNYNEAPVFSPPLHELFNYQRRGGSRLCCVCFSRRFINVIIYFVSKRMSNVESVFENYKRISRYKFSNAMCLYIGLIEE